MTEELDLPKTAALCRRAVLRHQMSERQMVMAFTLIDLTFGAHIPAPSLFLERAIDLARITGFSKGTSKLVIDQLAKARTVEVSPDKRIYTVVPPSEANPWIFLPRVDARVAAEITAAVLWASRSHAAGEGELYGRPDAAEREFPDAIQIERIRRALLDHHREAARHYPPPQGLRRDSDFPVTDHSPKPAPGCANSLSSGEGPSWPPGSTGGETPYPVQSLQGGCSPPVKSAELAGSQSENRGLTNREPGSQIENLPIKSFKVSELSDSQTQKLLKAVEFSNREPRRPIGASLPDIDPGMNEDGFIRWLRQVLGPAVMERYGGDWRNCWRSSRWTALNTVQNLRNRIANPDPSVKPLRNPGGWARDEYNRIRKEESEPEPEEGAES